MKYSIIIPTYNHLDDCLRPCITSICANTILDNDIEIIVVSNGSTDGTNDYLYEQQKNINNLRIITTDEPLGYPLAVNMGIQISKGTFLILLNNDTQILDYCEKNEWLSMLNRPFEDINVGITGPSKLYCKETNSNFIIFFCAMLRRKMLDEIGILDLIFGKGSSEDIDLCLRAEQNGWTIKKIPDDNSEWSYATKFPIYHKGEVTVHEIDDWEYGVYEKNLKIIKDRTDRSYYSDFADVTCEISTKGRYKTTLSLAIMSVVQQELKPKRVLIFQDDFNPHVSMPESMHQEDNDMTKQGIYKHILHMLDKAGIEWMVVYGEGKGQVRNHQIALEMAETEWIWRLDDDNYAESNVLRLLMESTGEGIAAVAPSVVDPTSYQLGSWSTKMIHINTHSNLQWMGKGSPSIVNAEHLYSTFIYRRSAGLVHGYDQALSVVGHREETIFTYNMFRDGNILLINRDAMVWHLRQDTGGIRSYNDGSLWSRDEAHFDALCVEWNVKPLKRLHVNLDGGRGDHYMFRMALPDIRKLHPDEIITVYAAYPECLDGEIDIEVKSVSEGISAVRNFELLGVYRWCMERRWDKSLVEAYKEIYK